MRAESQNPASSRAGQIQKDLSMPTMRKLREPGDSLYRAGRSEHLEIEPAAVGFSMPDDFSRDVYCILGVPVDAIGMLTVLRRIREAATRKTRFLVSTPNLNFLVTSQSNRSFRDSLILSDLCTADGMPVVWIARLMGIPIKSRTTGADMFEALKADVGPARCLKIFLFGGPEGAAEQAARKLNSEAGGLRCVGWSNPGFCSAEEMSQDDIIEQINASGADLLIASLSSLKGQSWLQRNHHRLRIPVRTHLGAALNFQAGTVRRAPLMFQKLGFEWLWRIKEEPYLWRRYWSDGRAMLGLLATRVLPFAFCTWLMRRSFERGEVLTVTRIHDPNMITLALSGPADADHVGRAIPAFRTAVASGKQVRLDFSNVSAIDARFLGLLMMLGKQLEARGCVSTFVGVSPLLARIFRLGGLEFRSATGSQPSAVADDRAAALEHGRARRYGR
jgi:N-acetylglucosaminyldiphosphoundecaprenol N-acetyl-beta-D-mannosaminyltransferase